MRSNCMRHKQRNALRRELQLFAKVTTVKKNKNNRAKGRFAGYFGIVSGSGSIISAHNVCHAVCLGVVAVLSVFGLAVSSTALMFLQDYNILFLTMGILFLLLSLVMYAKFGKCISTRLIIFNAGLVVAGTPFIPALQLVFWAAGFSIAIFVLAVYIKERVEVKI